MKSSHSDVGLLSGVNVTQHTGSLPRRVNLSQTMASEDKAKTETLRTVMSCNNFSSLDRSSIRKNTLERNLDQPSTLRMNTPIESRVTKGKLNSFGKRHVIGGSSHEQNLYSYSSEDESDQSTSISAKVSDDKEENIRDTSDDDFYQVPVDYSPETTTNGIDMGVMRDYLSSGFSGIYGIFIVVFGAVIPLAESFAAPNLPFVFEAFYVYLYIASVLFLLYVYLFLLRKNTIEIPKVVRSMSRSFTRRKPDGAELEKGVVRQKRVTMESDHTTGSFYLRLGAIVFGVGSMIHSGLHFGQYFQIYDGQSPCHKIIQAVKPFCHLVFSFVQLYFIFLNSKICVHRSKTIVRFGLMHMCGTNICVWFRCIVVETLSVMEQWDTKLHSLQPNKSSLTTDSVFNNSVKADDIPKDIKHWNKLSELNCFWGHLMGQIVQDAGPYLYPCTIEYSLICAGVLYVMWSNVGGGRNIRHALAFTDSIQNRGDIGKNIKSKHKMSIDCAHSSKGLFCGLLISVGAIITMIAFFVLVGENEFSKTAILISHWSETIMYLTMTIVCGFAAKQMWKLRFDHMSSFGLEENLLVISYTGLVMFAVFSLIPVSYITDSTDGVLTILTSSFMILQASVQTMFMLTSGRLYVVNKEQEKEKPGRELITFLIICNFAMWILNTFETRLPEHNPLQMGFYGATAWAIFTHVSVPLGIFYRFHSSVYLANIWKKAWKLKKIAS